jgi:UDP-N-acetylmuramoylalanine-D-glutamate ligase
MPFAAPESLRPLLASPAAVLGGGVVGESVMALLESLGNEGKVYDARGADFTAAAAQQHALAVFAPSFAPGHPWLARARTAGVECIGELDFAAACWRGKFLAITGTNGKTTLSEFLAHALTSIGRTAIATGAPASPFAATVAAKRGGSRDAMAVCEVSSAQAETLRHLRADAMLWTNFAEDHLERHGALENYFGAKWNLVAHTAGSAVFAGSSVARFAGPVVLIAGGKSKGGDLAGFVHRIAPRVKHVVLVGTTGADMAFHCATFRVAHTVCGALEEAVRRAAELAESGEHVLFSPGFASFDIFRNFEDRGDQFERFARDLAASSASLS